MIFSHHIIILPNKDSLEQLIYLLAVSLLFLYAFTIFIRRLYLYHLYFIILPVQILKINSLSSNEEDSK
jgi:hypothetical protein